VERTVDYEADPSFADDSINSTSGVYEVEELLSKRVLPDRSVEYLVKWKNYGEESNSWVSVVDLSCDELVSIS